jgi:hypothetical protein
VESPLPRWREIAAQVREEVLADYAEHVGWGEVLEA